MLHSDPDMSPSEIPDNNDDNDVRVWDQRHRQMGDRVYSAFLLAVNTNEISEAEFRLLAVQSASRILEAVFELKQSLGGVPGDVYTAFLLEAGMDGLSGPELHYAAVRSATRLLDGVECSLKPEVLSGQIGPLVGRPSRPTGTVEAVRHAIQTQPTEINRARPRSDR